MNDLAVGDIVEHADGTQYEVLAIIPPDSSGEDLAVKSLWSRRNFLVSSRHYKKPQKRFKVGKTYTTKYYEKIEIVGERKTGIIGWYTNGKNEIYPWTYTGDRDQQANYFEFLGCKEAT